MMHEDLRARLRDGLDAELASRPSLDLSEVLTRGRSKRLARRLVTTTMSIVLLGAALFGGFAASRALTNDAAPIPPADQTDFPALTETFVSSRNGFSVKYPGGAQLTPAKQAWGLGKQVDGGFDVVDTGLGAVFKGASAEGVGHLSGDGVLREGNEMEVIAPDSCGVPRLQQAEITIDGQPGRISKCANRIEASVVFGGRLYLFILSHDRSDARAVFDAFAATIDLTPETAVDFPSLTSTFVSPTYGYSFGYLDRGKGSLSPATEHWDPVHKQLEGIGSRADKRLDGAETGLGAYFGAASAEIPEGVSIDEWVDKYVSPGGCGVPRSQQAEITIDGRPGRIAECPSLIEATVVAGGRLYLFNLQHTRSDARAFFDAWVDTIDLTPETAAVP